MKFFTGASLSLMQAQPAQGPKPFIHKSFRLLYVKDEKNKELGGTRQDASAMASMVESPHPSFSSQEQ